MVLLSPYARPLRNGAVNAKNYPHWKELAAELSKLGVELVQVGVEGEEQLVPDFRKNLSIYELRKLIQECRTWIGVDSFFQHLAWDEGKRGIVLFGISDPLIFGHSNNINLLTSRSYLRKDQFGLWENESPVIDSFVQPIQVINSLRAFDI